jgi:hypothetical protein
MNGAGILLTCFLEVRRSFPKDFAFTRLFGVNNTTGFKRLPFMRNYLFPAFLEVKQGGVLKQLFN